MTFEVQLRNMVQSVELKLEALLGEDRLQAAGVPDRLAKAMRYAVLGAGKRVRPFLVMASGNLFGVPMQAASHVAAAVELVHCYSLAHDDLPAMDNDALRRGQASLWAAFDEHTAILAGDALVTMSFEMLADPGSGIDPTAQLELVAGLARASGPAGMVGGQQLDLDAAAASGAGLAGLEFIERLEAMKTGALITFSASAGGIIAGADRASRDALESYGRAIGLAFQIADDLLDVEGDAAVIGKAVGKDREANKATLIAMLGVETARRRLLDVRDEAVACLDAFGPEADSLRDAAMYIAGRQS